MIRPVGNYGALVSNAHVCFRCRFQARLQQLQRPQRQLSRRANASARNVGASQLPVLGIHDSVISGPQLFQSDTRFTSTASKKKAAAANKRKGVTPTSTAPAVANASEEDGPAKTKKKGKTTSSAKGDAALPENLPTPLSEEAARKRATIQSRRQERRAQKRTVANAVLAKIAGTLVRKMGGAVVRKEKSDAPIVAEPQESEGKQKARKLQKRAAEDLEKEVEDEISKTTNPLNGKSLKEALAAGDDNWASLIGADLKLEGTS